MRRSFFIPGILVIAVFCIAGRAQTRQRLNPMIDLLEQKKPVFGVYWPGNPQGRRGGPPPADAVMKPPSAWAKDALSYRNAEQNRGANIATHGASVNSGFNPGFLSRLLSSTQTQSPRRMTGSDTPPASTPSTSSSGDPIMKSTCVALRLPPARSNSSSLIVSPPRIVNL